MAKKMNADIAKALREIGFFLEMEDGVGSIYKARAYKRAADEISSLSSSIDQIYNKDGIPGILDIPSIGKAIASKIEEYIKTGRISYLEDLKSKTPINIDEFYGLEGIGPKTVKVLYDKLKIRTISELEKAATEGRLRKVPGFTEKKEYAILKNIDFLRKGKGRYLIGEVYPLIKQIESKLSTFAGVQKAIAAGSVRRMKETVGDIDYLVVSGNPEAVMDFFVNMPEVHEVLSRGPSKAFVRLNNGIDADLLVVDEKSFGSALQYFTGSKEHGVQLRKIAQSKGLRLNEWGVYDNNGKQLAGRSEDDVYNILGLSWIAPEMRENRGEIELAKKGALPELVEYGDLKGDLQVHTNNTDGTMSIEDMAIAAKEKFGLEYIAITDHTKSLKLAGGLDEDKLISQANRIAEINDRLHQQYPHFKILSSAEVNIMKDGTLDISNNVLDKLDIVGAAIHSHFGLAIEIQTERLVNAAKNPSVDIIFHPTGRLLNKREGYALDIEKVVYTAKDTGTVLEIDSFYDRLDLKDEYIQFAVQSGVKLAIDSDAHHPIHFAYTVFGIAQARRGWAKRSDIINTLPVNDLLKSLK